MRWCSFCATEFPEGTPMKIARGGTNICLPCSQTERGARECRDFNTTDGYRPNQRARAGKWSRIREAMGTPGYTRKRHGG